MGLAEENSCRNMATYAMDNNCKTDLVVNNISEVFNRMILDIRGKPIRTMVEAARDKLMVKFNEKRIGGRVLDGQLPQHIQKC